MEIKHFENDPGRWGASLSNVVEILIPCLEASGSRSVVEIGAYAGDLTGELLAWAAGSGASVAAIEPVPTDELLELADQRPELELIRETSHEALARIPLPDAVIIDGDHNYYTVSKELRLIGEKAEGAAIPLLLFHDVSWPHARRDSYWEIDRIPEQQRQPNVRGGGIFPGQRGITEGGLPFYWTAQREGGPRNGVLTAIEDFVDGREGLRLAVVPVFFGLGVVWSEAAPWAAAVAEVLAPWDRSPLLERLEANRVHHLATTHMLMVELARLKQRLADEEFLLRELLQSKAFALGERLARLRGQPRISREQVKEALRE
jgi:methyltransferase family protein